MIDCSHEQTENNRVSLNDNGVKTDIWIEGGRCSTLRATVVNALTTDEYELFFSESQFAAREDLRNFFSDVRDLFHYLSHNPQSILSEGRGEIRFTLQMVGTLRREKEFLLTLMRKRENQI
jgi:hypothetical protein